MDLTYDEFISKHAGYVPIEFEKSSIHIDSKNLKKQINWIEKGAVNPP